MAVLPILTYPDSRLQRKADPVSVFDDDLHHFIDDLTETMYAGP
ncbi:peptide deformylase, partial [Acidithiobacillus ferrooxidans]|nr:peptide deformylase [Acidithiobacillus ferrooxidans]